MCLGGAGKTQIHTRPAAKTYSVTSELEKFVAITRSRGSFLCFGLRWTGGYCLAVFLSPLFWKPVSLSADISISDQAWQKLARRTAALFAVYGAVLASVWPYYLSAGTACINITLTLLESISDQAWQKLARRTAALFAVYGAVLASAWPYQEHRHNTWLSKLWGLEPAGQAKLVTNGAEVGGGCLGFRGVAVKWIRCNPALKVSEVCMKSLGTIDILRACLVHNVHHALVCRTL